MVLSEFSIDQKKSLPFIRPSESYCVRDSLPSKQRFMKNFSFQFFGLSKTHKPTFRSNVVCRIDFRIFLPVVWEAFLSCDCHMVFLEMLEECETILG